MTSGRPTGSTAESDSGGPGEPRAILERLEIPTFLFFGYVPRLPEDLDSEPWVAPRLGTTIDENDITDERRLVSEGASALRSAFEATQKTARTKFHLAPLSGGLDSRGVLGGLLAHRSASEITAVTYGLPGTLDYEIGSLVARAAGVRNECIDLSALRLTTGALVELVRRRKCRFPVFDAYPIDQLHARVGPDSTFWSGFMGDCQAGTYLTASESRTWDEALAKFIDYNRYSKTVELAPPGFQPREQLPHAPLFERSFMAYDDQLGLAFREQCWFKLTVLPEDREYAMPYLHPAWVSFILSRPHRHRFGKRLYKKVLMSAFPELFSLPTTHSMGLRIDAPKWRRACRRLRHRAMALVRRVLPRGPWPPPPRTKFFDYREDLRQRQDLKSVVHENIRDLERRGLVDWLDIGAIWTSHQRRQGDHTQALVLLASLELILKAQRGPA